MKNRIKILLLTCGIVSSMLYVSTDIFASMQWKDYSYFDQAFSELVAIEAPTRPLMLFALGILYNLLVTAFAIGVWSSAGKRALRITAGLLFAYAIVGFFGGVIFPMHSRGVSETMALTDKMHVTFTSLGILLMLLFIGFGGAAFEKRFRYYSIGTILLLVLGGAYAYWAAFTQMAVQLPTPGMGITERINIYANMLWIIIFSIVLLQRGQNIKTTSVS